MESPGNNDRRTIAVGRPPLTPASERMTGQSSQKPNIDPEKLKRKLANRQHAKTHHLRQTSQIKKLEQTVQCLEVDVKGQFAQIYYLKKQSDMSLIENGELKKKFDYRSLDMEFKKAQYLELKKERDDLRQLYVGLWRKYEELMECNMGNARFMYMDRPGRPAYNFV